jgi:hypothetical protein
MLPFIGIILGKFSSFESIHFHNSVAISHDKLKWIILDPCDVREQRFFPNVKMTTEKHNPGKKRFITI